MRTLLVLAVFVSACGPRSGVNVARKVQPSMYRINTEMRALDRGVAVQDPKARKQNVLTALDRIESITRELATSELRESHSLMETEIDGFFAEVVKARKAADANPPNYYWAGRLHATCIRCHDPEGGVWLR